MKTNEAWGRIYAIIDSTTKGGIRPAMLNNAALNPGQFFTAASGNTIPLIKGDKETRMMELMQHVDPNFTANYNAGDQASFLMAFTREKQQWCDDGQAKHTS